MLESVLILGAAPGRLRDLLQYYQDHQVVEAAIPFGLLRGELITRSQPHSELVVASLWSGRAAYEAWGASGKRAALVEGMAHLIDLRRRPHARAWDVSGIRDSRHQPLCPQDSRSTYEGDRRITVSAHNRNVAEDF